MKVLLLMLKKAKGLNEYFATASDRYLRTHKAGLDYDSIEVIKKYVD